MRKRGLHILNSVHTLGQRLLMMTSPIGKRDSHMGKRGSHMDKEGFTWAKDVHMSKERFTWAKGVYRGKKGVHMGKESFTWATCMGKRGSRMGKKKVLTVGQFYVHPCQTLYRGSVSTFKIHTFIQRC
jgi:hypothetical protein